MQGIKALLTELAGKQTAVTTTSAAPSPSPDTRFARLDRAADQTRGAAKWLLTVFAAIAGVLLAGSQFASIGSAHGLRLIMAMIGAAIALGAAATVIWFLLGVIVPRSRTLGDLAASDADREFLELNPEMLFGYETLAELRQTYRDAIVAARAWQLDYINKALDPETTETELKAAEGFTRAADAWKRYVSSTVTTLLNGMTFRGLERQFSFGRRVGMFVGGVFVAVGITLFAWGANPPKKPKATAAAGAELAGAHLEGAQLSLAQLAGVDLHNAHLERAMLVGANLAGADLSGSYLVAANLRGGDLRRAKLQDVTWGDTICPDGTSSNAHLDGCASHRFSK